MACWPRAVGGGVHKLPQRLVYTLNASPASCVCTYTSALVKKTLIEIIFLPPDVISGTNRMQGWIGDMAQQVSKPENLITSLGPTWWKDSTDSYTLSSTLRKCCGLCSLPNEINGECMGHLGSILRILEAAIAV